MTGNRSERRAWGVASPHPAATEAAAGVLSTGGTAVDGALAAAGVLAVVYPHNCSVGGDLIALVRRRGELPRVVFGVGRSAGAIDPDGLRRRFGERVPLTGPFSISVPGVVSGWQALHDLGGRLPFGQLLAPAIELAARGAQVSSSVARALRALDSADQGLDEIFGPRGDRLGPGETFVQPRLAETLSRIASDPETFYRGELAAQLARGLEAAGSPIRLEDFSRHHAVVGKPAVTGAGHLAPRLFAAGFPSQGIFFAGLAEIVSRLLGERHDLLGRDAGMLARAFDQTSKIRDELLSDPSRAPGADALRARLARVDLSAPSSSLPSTGKGAPLVAGEDAEGVAKGASAPSGDTVAVVVYDEHGNSVSMLQSVFHSFGSQFCDPATGVLYHNRQSMFTLRPGMPGELGPGLMPPHTLCPAMVDALDADGAAEVAPLLVLSSMGGRSQPQILVQVLLRLAAGNSVSEAVSAPRFVIEDTDTVRSRTVVTAEADLPTDATTSLLENGLDVRTVSAWNEETGHCQVLRAGANGVMEAGADPRSDGIAMHS